MSFLAALRPGSFNLPLFLHVLGATLLFGGVLTMTITGFAARGRPMQTASSSRASLRGRFSSS